MIEKRDAALMRSTGVSHFNPDHLDRIMEANGVTPVLNQIEVNPKMSNAALRAENAAHGVVTQGCTPFGEAKKSDFPQITGICTQTGKSPAQVILRWHMQLGASAVPRAASAAHQEENLDIFDFELSEDEMARLATRDWNARCDPDALFVDWE